MKAWLSAPVLLLFVDGIWAKLEFRTKNSAGLGKTAGNGLVHSRKNMQFIESAPSVGNCGGILP